MQAMSESNLFWDVFRQSIEEIKEFVSKGPALKWWPMSKVNAPYQLWQDTDYKLMDVIRAKQSMKEMQEIAEELKNEDPNAAKTPKAKAEPKPDRMDTILDTLIESIHEDALADGDRVVRKSDDSDEVEDSLKQIMSLVSYLSIGVVSTTLVICLSIFWQTFMKKTDSELSANWLECQFSAAVLVVLALAVTDLNYCCVGRVRSDHLDRDVRLYQLAVMVDWAYLTHNLLVYLPEHKLLSCGMIIFIPVYAARLATQYAIAFLLTKAKTKSKTLKKKLDKLFETTKQKQINNLR